MANGYTRAGAVLGDILSGGPGRRRQAGSVRAIGNAAQTALAMQQARNARDQAMALENWSEKHPQIADVVRSGIARELVNARKARGLQSEQNRGQEVWQMLEHSPVGRQRLADMARFALGKALASRTVAQNGAIIHPQGTGENARPVPLAPSEVAKNMATAGAQKARAGKYAAKTEAIKHPPAGGAKKARRYTPKQLAETFPGKPLKDGNPFAPPQPDQRALYAYYAWAQKHQLDPYDANNRAAYAEEQYKNKFVNGQIYTDAAGNRALYKDGQFIPVGGG